MEVLTHKCFYMDAGISTFGAAQLVFLILALLSIFVPIVIVSTRTI